MAGVRTETLRPALQAPSKRNPTWNGFGGQRRALWRFRMVGKVTRGRGVIRVKKKGYPMPSKKGGKKGCA